MAEKIEKSEKNGASKVVIIILLVVILLLIALIAVFILTGGNISSLTTMFKDNSEYTLLLEEFVINLKPENGNVSYLKTTIALMYTDKDYTELLNNNISKLRDVIISDFREKSESDFTDQKSINALKKQIISDVNAVLHEDIIKDVYINDIVTQ